ncbi:MAG: ribose-5-phosphate isomerase RpiA [Ignavibacteria bacterium]
MSEQDVKNEEKKLAAEKAVEFIKDGMIVGLGSGTTVYFAIKKIGSLVREGLNIIAVSTSVITTELAQSEGINLISLDEAEEIDVTIDGADEVEKNSLNGIKGGGGALLYEKIVALSSKKNIWIVDSGKLVDVLGRYPLPVEVIPFGCKRVFKILKERKLDPVIRKNGNSDYKTDSDNYIFDLHTGEIPDVKKLNDEIKLISGVVETGLFIGIADTVIVAREGSTEVLEKKQ